MVSDILGFRLPLVQKVRAPQLTMQKMKEDVPTELGAECPKWWTFEYKNDWIYLLRDTSNSGSPGRKGFYSETEYFAYDPKTEIAYYRFLGID